MSNPDGDGQRRRADPETAVLLGHLVLQDGSTAVVLEGRTLVIGSSDGCDVRLEGEGVAPRHCVIRPSGRDLVVEHLGGEGGTLLNGAPIRRSILEHGDDLGIAGQHLRFRTTAGALGRAGRAITSSPWRGAVGLVLLVALASVAAWLAARRFLTPAVDRAAQPPVTRELAVASEPAGAWVWIDGRYRGEAPIAISVSAERGHRVRLSKPGYVDWEARVPAAASHRRVLAKLRQRPTGRLFVRAYPRAAALYVAGMSLEPCPADLRVPCGRHIVRVESQGYEPFETTVDVGPDANVSVRCVLRHLRPESLLGAVRAHPRDARAYVALVRALFSRGNTDEAVANLRIALGLVASRRDTSQWRTALRDELADLYFDPPVPGPVEGVLSRVRDALDRAFRDATLEYADLALLRVFVDILIRARKPALAAQLCEDLIARTPETPGPYTCLAELYRAERQYDNAEAVLILGEAARRPGRDACFALAVAWSRLAPHCKAAKARAEAELAKALDACDTLDERRRMAEDFEQLAWGRGGGP